MENMGDNTINSSFSDQYLRIGSGSFANDQSALNSEWATDYDGVRRCNAFLENYKRAAGRESVKESMAGGWKGLDFTFFLQGVGKASGYIRGAARHAYINESSAPQKFHLDRWTPDNPNASYPRFTYQLTHNQRLSSFWLENAAYLRLKNIQLGYTLPGKLIERYRLTRLRLFVSADNFFTKSKFFYAYDPETPVSTGGYYPQVKTFIVGINLNIR
jgi:hypothetical protein